MLKTMPLGKIKSAAMYGIRLRVGHWAVAIQRDGVTLGKIFSFTVYGSQAAALRQAQAWRDEIVRQHPPATRQQFAATSRRNNTSGYTGVKLANDRDGIPRYWEASTRLGPGNTVRKFFSIKRYGNAHAKELAIAERQRQLELIEGRIQTHPDEAKLREIPVPRLLPADHKRPKRLPQESLNTSNTSGYPGVSFRVDKNWNIPYWMAITRVGGKTMTKSFSIKRYGDAQAKRLAIAERQRQMEQVLKLADEGKTPKRGPRRQKISAATAVA
ncbi:AP2/ERF family transcription factor [Variovorax paradoxus]|uniref:AP2/ERF family transcription factor n=1 Tax=Variovorax paradoxus TaxID=34073 RepID=UPI003D6563BC